jgi:hypothetical protein
MRTTGWRERRLQIGATGPVGPPQPEEPMTETNEKTPKTISKAEVRAQRDHGSPTCRTILIAACVGVLIGLLLKR